MLILFTLEHIYLSLGLIAYFPKYVITVSLGLTFKLFFHSYKFVHCLKSFNNPPVRSDKILVNMPPTFPSLRSGILSVGQPTQVRDPFLVIYFSILPPVFASYYFCLELLHFLISGVKTNSEPSDTVFMLMLPIFSIVIFKSIVLDSIFQKFIIFGSFIPCDSIIYYCLGHYKQKLK